MWKDLQNGRDFPDIVTLDEYVKIKENQDGDMGLAGFVGFGCSYGGKWWGGLAREHRGDNFCKTPKKSLMRDFNGLKTAEFMCEDYRDVFIPDGAVVYADPPYDKTTGYSTGAFESKAFWEHMRKISQNANVFISEETAPDDFLCVWEKPLLRQIDNQRGNTFIKTEKLFTLRK